MRFTNEQERLRHIYEQNPDAADGYYKAYKKTCPVCGIVFYTKVRYQIVCGGCKTKWDTMQRKARRQRATYYLTCPVCGQRFTAHRKDAKYCSAACRQKCHRKNTAPALGQ